MELAEVFEQLRQAHARGDAEAAAALYAPDGVLWEAGNVAHRGRDAVRAHLGAYFVNRGPVELTVKRQITTADAVFVEWTSAFTVAGHRSSGNPGASVLEVGSGGIAYHHDYL